MNYDYLNIIGLMSGTSMDGINVSLVKTNGIDLIRLKENFFYEYSNKTKNFLLNILNKDLNFNLNRKKYLDDIVTYEHFKALDNIDIVSSSDLIGFHGQTIYHDPQKKCSIQLGNPKKLARMLNKKVVFNFREQDIIGGGQGAPLAPIYHKLIMQNNDLRLPCCILNIGGITNLTYWDNEILIGFDTGPGNGLMDNYMKLKTNKYFDQDGFLASKGEINKEIVKNFTNDTFFQISPPKSLDRNSFVYLYNKLLKKNLSISDTLATLAEITIESIVKSQKFLPKEIKTILVTGGGYKNKYIVKRLMQRLEVDFLSDSQLGIDFNFIESELIAYLSARSIYKLPFTFPSTTGISKPTSGGYLYDFL